MKKCAYTIAEILLVLGIISILAVLSLVSIKSTERKTIQMMYNKSHYVLLMAAYNIRLELKKQNFNNPSSKTIDKLTDQEFCELLTKWFNIIPCKNDSNCNSENNTCHLANYVGYLGKNTDFIDNNIKFTTSNGVRFYMAKMFESSPLSAGDPNDRHRIIWVDVNGKKLPNSANCSSGNFNCDTFAFDILNESDVLPLGYPKLEKGFVKSSINLPYDPNGAKNQVRRVMSSYYEAQCKAYGDCSSNSKYRPKKYFDVYSHTIEDVTNTNKQQPFKGGFLELTTEILAKYARPIMDQCRDDSPNPGVDFPQCGLQVEF